MYCNYVLYSRNNCLKASHNPTISNCRRFGFHCFSLSRLWPCLLSPLDVSPFWLSPFWFVAVLTVNRSNIKVFMLIGLHRLFSCSCYHMNIHWPHISCDSSLLSPQLSTPSQTRFSAIHCRLAPGPHVNSPARHGSKQTSVINQND